MLLNLSASPFHRGKFPQRLDVIRATAQALNTPVAYCNAVGGQDELVFDGGSFVMGADGVVLAQAARFEEELLHVDLPVRSEKKNGTASSEEGADWIFLSPDAVAERSAAVVKDLPEKMGELEEIYRALCLGLKDYTEKNRFESVLVAISGGIAAI